MGSITQQFSSYAKSKKHWAAHWMSLLIVTEIVGKEGDRVQTTLITRNRKRRLTWPLWMTPQDVADMFGVHRNTVYEWIRAGELPSKKLGTLIFIDRDALFLRGEANATQT